MKLKIELTPEEWGLVTAALRNTDKFKKEFEKINENMMEQLEVQFQEWEKPKKKLVYKKPDFLMRPGEGFKGFF